MKVFLSFLSLLNIAPVVAAWGFTGLVVVIGILIIVMRSLRNIAQVKWNIWAGIVGTTASILAFNAPVITLLIGLANLTIALAPDKI